MQRQCGRPFVSVLVLLVLVAALGAGCGAASRQTTLGDAVDDSAITAQVKARLAAAEAETLASVDVDTVNGVVYLNGTVDDPTLKTQAEQIARSEEGVRRVVNNLQVAVVR